MSQDAFAAYVKSQKSINQLAWKDAYEALYPIPVEGLTQQQTARIVSHLIKEFMESEAANPASLTPQELVNLSIRLMISINASAARQMLEGMGVIPSTKKAVSKASTPPPEFDAASFLGGDEVKEKEEEDKVETSTEESPLSS